MVFQNFFLKLCKNDLLTGKCLNKIINIDSDDLIVTKIFESDKNISKTKKYKGCH